VIAICIMRIFLMNVSTIYIYIYIYTIYVPNVNKNLHEDENEEIKVLEANLVLIYRNSWFKPKITIDHNIPSSLS